VDDDEARRLLHAERDRLTALLHDSADDVADQQDTDRDAGDADAAKDVVDREMERSELRQLHAQLREVDDALARVDEGTYGVSEVSGEPIPDERLRARPASTRTVEEQEAVDNQGRASVPDNPDLQR
jgi:RNA polymerase-binding transcription factor DksA